MIEVSAAILAALVVGAVILIHRRVSRIERYLMVAEDWDTLHADGD